MEYQNNRRPLAPVRSVSDRQPREKLSKNTSPKPTHDTILGGLRNKGATVSFDLMSGESITGQISQRDKFTVTVKLKDGRLVTIFKHAIECFFVSDSDDSREQ